MSTGRSVSWPRARAGKVVFTPWLNGERAPVDDRAAIAAERGVGFHTDACLGGFVLPWAERLGYAVAPFDFRVAGVTSMSCDTHKFGYGAKGTSVLLWRDPELRDRQ